MSDIDLDDVLSPEAVRELAHDSRMAEVHTAIPGRVVSYDAATQRADVRPLVQRTVPRVDGGVLAEDLPVVRSVPVMWPRGGGYFVHLPLAEGDDVLLVCAEADPARYLDSGQPGAPIDHRRHHLAHAFAIPGVHPSAGALEATDAIAGELVVGKEGSGPLVRITGTAVKIGRNATEKATRAPKIDQHLAKIALALDALITLASGGAVTVEPNYGVAAKAVLDVAQPIATTVAEVE